MNQKAITVSSLDNFKTNEKIVIPGLKVNVPTRAIDVMTYLQKNGWTRGRTTTTHVVYYRSHSL